MPTDPIQINVRDVGLSDRFCHSEDIVASPAAGQETIIASLTLPSNLTYTNGVLVYGWAALTVGTDGVSLTLKVRQTSVSGSTIVSSGAVTAVATNLRTVSVSGFDTGPLEGGIYKLTLTVGSGSAASTVSAVQLVAVAI